ncbi:MAG: MFS transporter [Chloroflexi bacterium]|nr:MFS transporter [Chloroflexota bacterium]
MNTFIWSRLIRAPYGVAVGGSILLQGLMLSMISPLIAILLTEQIGLDKNEVIVFFLLNTLMGAVVTLGTGWLSDGIVAPYKLVIFGGVTGMLGFVGLAQATQPSHAWLAGLALAQFGVVFPQLFAIAKAGVVASWEHEAQVMGMTVLRTMFSLGFVIGTVISSVLARMDIRGVFMALAIPNLIVALSAAYLLYRMDGSIQRQTQPESGEPSGAAAPVQRALPLWVLVVPMLAMLLMRGADSTRTAYLPLVTLQLFNDASIAPLMFSLSAAAELVAMGLMGYVAGKFGEKNAIAIGAFVGAAYYLVMSFSQSLPLLYTSNVVYALFTGATAGVAMVYLQHLMGHRRGLGGSLYMTLFNVGNLIGILAPLLVQNYDQRIFIAPVLLCFGGAVLMLVGDRTAGVQRA